eukprot:CAMPEP_0176004206 /NCGR_PEP_ID=MMETSP0120_2-20121206/1571_1 /TAXON_ID=160619 /ORGANISM="Kryptoperidinium foliaceum, Strain CCMP 1326" /LENGTH=196 /DNA_ID=CAMNT_0017336875 /DNA_START=117 /DNA_END=704 /DNA_ORIENTATION=+
MTFHVPRLLDTVSAVIGPLNDIRKSCKSSNAAAISMSLVCPTAPWAPQEVGDGGIASGKGSGAEAHLVSPSKQRRRGGGASEHIASIPFDVAGRLARLGLRGGTCRPSRTEGGSAEGAPASNLRRQRSVELGRSARAARATAAAVAASSAESRGGGAAPTLARTGVKSRPKSRPSIRDRSKRGHGLAAAGAPKATE